MSTSGTLRRQFGLWMTFTVGHSNGAAVKRFAHASLQRSCSGDSVSAVLAWGSSRGLYMLYDVSYLICAQNV